MFKMEERKLRRKTGYRLHQHGISIWFTTSQQLEQGPNMRNFYLHSEFLTINCSATFHEVEKVLQQQVKDGNISGLLTLQRQIAQAVGTGTYYKYTVLNLGLWHCLWGFSFYFENETEGHRSGFIPKAVIPVDDIGNVDPPGYVKGEKELRCKLASLYRLVDHFGWSQAIFNHITVIDSCLHFDSKQVWIIHF